MSCFIVCIAFVFYVFVFNVLPCITVVMSGYDQVCVP